MNHYSHSDAFDKISLLRLHPWITTIDIILPDLDHLKTESRILIVIRIHAIMKVQIWILNRAKLFWICNSGTTLEFTVVENIFNSAGAFTHCKKPCWNQISATWCRFKIGFLKRLFTVPSLSRFPQVSDSSENPSKYYIYVSWSFFLSSYNDIVNQRTVTSVTNYNKKTTQNLTEEYIDAQAYVILN
jgi:hypothetical protein